MSSTQTLLLSFDRTSYNDYFDFLTTILVNFLKKQVDLLMNKILIFSPSPEVLVVDQDTVRKKVLYICVPWGTIS